MSSNICRTVLIETIGLSDQCLTLIGKSVSETIRLATSRVIQRPTITHLISYLIDIKTQQISPLLDIKSEQFCDEYLSKLSQLKRPIKQFVRNRIDSDIAPNIAIILKEIRDSIKRSKELTKTELTYVSGRGLDEVIDDLMYAFGGQQIDSSFLFQINILCIKSFAKQDMEPVVCGPTSATLLQNCEQFQALLEIQTIDESENSIDGYFKVWLHELNTRSERVRIYLNSDSAQNKTKETFVIKCDLKEALIDLNRMEINRNDNKIKSSQSQAFESLPNISDKNGCYELELLGLISRLGLCDAVLYGIPYILSATRSAALEFDELELNSERFYGLIEVMNEKNAVIILELRQQNNCLKSFFALMSSPDTKTLIMKSIATKELVLPYFTDSVDTLVSRTASKSVVDSVRKQLNDFPFANIYNPLLIENNLFNLI